ncbi:MAG: undecaprenyl-diphosphate phosphatase [Chloroflexi bacterium]|nr:undecaprenyl-diphosphate phosphatase [Chloroflexota bacterium]
MEAAALLGLLQGLVEWLPVSSEGVVAGVYALTFDSSLDEAVGFAVWLHLGTVPSVLIALRRDIVDVIREFLARPQTPSPTVRFLAIATLVSGVVGLPLLLVLRDISSVGGSVAAGLTGSFMVVTGYVQLRRRASDQDVREELNLIDSLLVGVAQGFSVIPGLSRSGMTVAALLSRRVDRKRALTLSFLLSIPVSLAASLYVGIESGLVFDPEAIIAASVAFVVGLLTIKTLMSVADRMNLGWFVIAVGAVMIAGALIASLL